MIKDSCRRCVHRRKSVIKSLQSSYAQNNAMHKRGNVNFTESNANFGLVWHTSLGHLEIIVQVNKIKDRMACDAYRWTTILTAATSTDRLGKSVSHKWPAFSQVLLTVRRKQNHK